jgi:hypothetical protein
MVGPRNFICKCKRGFAGNGSFCADDSDLDGIPDKNISGCSEKSCIADNCPNAKNSDQGDEDDDGFGDACDNCPYDHNVNQEDSDSDLVGDICDTDEDRDRDGIQDDFDNCPNDSNSDQANSDFDGFGDACDSDKDDDDIPNDQDRCPLLHNITSCPKDQDGDGVPDVQDVCPLIKGITMTDFCRNTEVNLRGTPRFPSNWEVSDKCRVIRQTANSDPTALIGYHRLGSVDFQGQVYVEKNDDDDYIGLVFAYQSSSRFYLVSWKQTADSVNRARPGVEIKKVLSRSGPSPTLEEALGRTGNTPNEVYSLWRDVKEIPWKVRRVYSWKLEHRPENGLIRVRFYEGGKEIIDSGDIYDSEFKGGRLGFYSNSQEKVTWSSIRYTCPRPPTPRPTIAAK